MPRPAWEGEAGALLDLLEDGWHQHSLFRSGELDTTASATAQPTVYSAPGPWASQGYTRETQSLPAGSQRDYDSSPEPSPSSFLKQNSDSLLLSSRFDLFTAALAQPAGVDGAQPPLPVLPLQVPGINAPRTTIQDAARQRSAPPSPQSTNTAANNAPATSTVAAAPVPMGAGAPQGPSAPPQHSSDPAAASSLARNPMRFPFYRSGSKAGSMIFGMSMSAMDVFQMDSEAQQAREEAVNNDANKASTTQGAGQKQPPAAAADAETAKGHNSLPVSELIALLKANAAATAGRPAPPKQATAAAGPAPAPAPAEGLRAQIAALQPPAGAAGTRSVMRDDSAHKRPARSDKGEEPTHDVAGRMRGPLKDDSCHGGNACGPAAGRKSHDGCVSVGTKATDACEMTTPELSFTDMVENKGRTLSEDGSPVRGNGGAATSYTVVKRQSGSQVYEVPYPLPYPLYEPAPVGHEAGAGRGAVCQPVRVVGFNVRNNQLPA